MGQSNSVMTVFLRDVLYRLWHLSRNRPGWLSDLHEILGLSDEEETYLNDLDTEWTMTMRALESEWRRDVARRLAEFRRSIVERHSGSGLTEAQIARARLWPLEAVLETQPVKGFIHCPLHPERVGHVDKHPSMLVKEGFGYCFACGGRLDAIGYLMRIRCIGFRQAVEELQ